MAKDVTTIRIDSALRKAILREAKKAGLSFSDIVQLLLRMFIDQKMHVGVTQYPKGYIEKLEKEADALHKAYLKGKVKGYSSGKEMIDDILGR